MPQDVYKRQAFLNAIKSYGFNSEEEYLEKASYPSLLNKELLKKYAKDNQKTLFEKYHPVKANVIQIEKQENAEKALAALKKMCIRDSGTSLPKYFLKRSGCFFKAVSVSRKITPFLSTSSNML